MKKNKEVKAKEKTIETTQRIGIKYQTLYFINQKIGFLGLRGCIVGIWLWQ